MRIYIPRDISSFYIMRLMAMDLRAVAIVAAVLLYGAMGAPTPDGLSAVEGIVGALIVVGVGAGGFISVLRLRGGGARYGAEQPQGQLWFLLGQVFLIYGVVFGVCGALLRGASIAEVLRDMLPFGFMFLPLFMSGFMAGRLEGGRFGGVYIAAFVMLGGMFAVRAGAPVMGFSFDARYEALYYLGNSPAVLFAALYVMGRGMEVLSKGINVRAFVVAAACFMVCAVMVVPIVMTAQRASMAAIVVYAFLAFLVLFKRSPRRMVIVGAIMAVFVIASFGGIVGDFISGAFESAADKSALVGANMRFEEWAAVWGEISAHPITVLFGRGWGASFSSPAVADIEVYYTHSMLSSMLLKVGVVGFVLCAGYVGALFFKLLREVHGQEIIVMAIVAPLLIDVFLYAAFKSLDFGLLLLLIPVVINWQSGASRIASNAPILYENHKGAIQ